MAPLQFLEDVSNPPALGSQDGQTEKEKENPLQNRKEKTDEAEHHEGEADDDFGHPP